MDKQEIIKNCIFGLAVGDALGVPYEFMRRDQTQAVDLTNMKSYGYFHKQPAGAWSDDTAMTLASMDSITRSRGFAPDDMMAAFQDWYQNGAYTSTGETFGVGRTVYHALRKAQNLLPALQCGQKRFHDNGNGSLMCVALVALYCAFHDLGRADEVRLVGDASAITHAHEISKLGCLIYTDYLKLIINGINKLAAYDKCCEIDYSNAFSKKALKAYERVLHGGLPELRQHKLAVWFHSYALINDGLSVSVRSFVLDCVPSAKNDAVKKACIELSSEYQPLIFELCDDKVRASLEIPSDIDIEYLGKYCYEVFYRISSELIFANNYLDFVIHGYCG